MDLTALKGCQLTEERIGHPLAPRGGDIIGLYFLKYSACTFAWRAGSDRALVQIPRLLVDFMVVDWKWGKKKKWGIIDCWFKLWQHGSGVGFVCVLYNVLDVQCSQWHFIKCPPPPRVPAIHFFLYLTQSHLGDTAGSEHTESGNRYFLLLCITGGILGFGLKLIWETGPLLSDPSSGANLGGHGDKFRHRVFSSTKLDQTNGPWKTCLCVPGNKWKPSCDRN